MDRPKCSRPSLRSMSRERPYLVRGEAARSTERSLRGSAIAAQEDFSVARWHAGAQFRETPVVAHSDAEARNCSTKGVGRGTCRLNRRV
jgi:hypothetical protein